MNDPASVLLTERVLSYLLAESHGGRTLVTLDNIGIALALQSQYPQSGRPSMHSVERSLRELRRQGVIRRAVPLSRVVRIVPPTNR